MRVSRRVDDANSPIAWQIFGIEGDMGESTQLDLTQQQDGDVIVEITDTETGQNLSIEFCTHQGGSHDSRIAEKLRELILLLAGESR